MAGYLGYLALCLCLALLLICLFIIRLALKRNTDTMETPTLARKTNRIEYNNSDVKKRLIEGMSVAEQKRRRFLKE